MKVPVPSFIHRYTNINSWGFFYTLSTYSRFVKRLSFQIIYLIKAAYLFIWGPPWINPYKSGHPESWSRNHSLVSLFHLIHLICLFLLFHSWFVRFSPGTEITIFLIFHSMSCLLRFVDIVHWTFFDCPLRQRYLRQQESPVFKSVDHQLGKQTCSLNPGAIKTDFSCFLKFFMPGPKKSCNWRNFTQPWYYESTQGCKKKTVVSFFSFFTLRFSLDWEHQRGPLEITMTG